MNNSGKILVGLDIGTTKIAVLVGRYSENGKFEILGTGKSESFGVKRGVVWNIEKTIDAIKIAVQEAENRSGVNIKVVNVGIAGQHIKSMQYRGLKTRQSLDDEISPNDVQSLIDDMYKMKFDDGSEIIHVLPQDFRVDNEMGIKNPIGMSGIRLEGNFHIITGQVTSINNLVKCVKRAGLEISDLTLEPLASAESVLSEEEKEAGVVLIDIGGGTTDVAIFQDGIIRHTAVIPFGGDIITEDIKEGCSIIKNQAELLKVKFGSALASENLDNEIVSIPGLKGRDPKEISMKNLAGIIEARLEEIIMQAKFEITSSGYEKQLIGGIVLTGGGALMRHIVQLTQYLTGMDVRIGYPTEHISSGADEVKSPMFATGVGLMISGLSTGLKKSSKTSNNFSNSEQKNEGSQIEAETTTEIEEEKTEEKKEEKSKQISSFRKNKIFDIISKWISEDPE
jgi:cell division protein FtsA